MIEVPFFKPSITEKEIKAVVDVLRSGWLTTGPRTKEFESDFAAFMGRKHAVAVNSCTAALHLALEARGVRRGDVVAVPVMTFAATAEVVRYFGAIPLFVDCKQEDYNLDCEDARRKLRAARKAGKRVKGIIPMHYGGQICDMVAVQEIAREMNLFVVEDAAHCCPAWFRVSKKDAWKPPGALSDISCFSFYANKCITTGEGGMACTDDDKIADRMRVMALHGISKDAWKRYTAAGSWRYEIIAPGFKYNLTDMAAALGVVQLKRCEEFLEQRRRVAERYIEELQDLPEIRLPREQPNRIHGWHLFEIRLRTEKLNLTRADFIQEMKNRGIGCSVHWIPLHHHPYYQKHFPVADTELPNASVLSDQLVSLPLYPGMTQAEVEHVCASVREIIGQHRKSGVRRSR